MLTLRKVEIRRLFEQAARDNPPQAEVAFLLQSLDDPRNVGSLDKQKRSVGTGVVGAPECGDVMKLQIEVEGDRIVDAKFKTFGCGSAIASSSLATEWIKGKTLDEANTIRNTTTIVPRLPCPAGKLSISAATILISLAESALTRSWASAGSTPYDTSLARTSFRAMKSRTRWRSCRTSVASVASRRRSVETKEALAMPTGN